jgi:hypothetical protein
VVLVLAVSGCGARVATKTTTTPPPPRLPRTFAQTWAQQADAVAAALAAGDTCAAQTVANLLRAEVVQAVNARRIPAALQEQLLGVVNDIPDRIVCVPPPGNGPGHDKHGKHGGDHGGGGD